MSNKWLKVALVMLLFTVSTLKVLLYIFNIRTITQICTKFKKLIVFMEADSFTFHFLRIGKD